MSFGRHGYHTIYADRTYDARVQLVRQIKCIWYLVQDDYENFRIDAFDEVDAIIEADVLGDVDAIVDVVGIDAIDEVNAIVYFADAGELSLFDEFASFSESLSSEKFFVNGERASMTRYFSIFAPRLPTAPEPVKKKINVHDKLPLLVLAVLCSFDFDRGSSSRYRSTDNKFE